jgi:hypothetical protein
VAIDPWNWWQSKPSPPSTKNATVIYNLNIERQPFNGTSMSGSVLSLQMVKMPDGY